jgi:hypothetical protein
MTDIVVKGRQAQLFRVSHFNPAGIALTSFLQLGSMEVDSIYRLFTRSIALHNVQYVK